MFSPSSPPQSRQAPMNGQFRNGIWYCNCKPPRPARFQVVKKETSEHIYKPFYGCPVNGTEGNRCTMFVLADDAEQRQWECFKSSGRSEKRQTTILESFSLSKAKRTPGKSAPVIETIDLEALGDESTTLPSAAALTSNPASPSGSQLEPSSSAETSTLKDSSENPYSGLGDIYDASPIEDEIEGGLNNRTSNNTTLQPSGMAETAIGKRPGSASKRKAQNGELGRHRNPFITPTTVRTTDMENGLPTPSRTNINSVIRLLFEDESSRTSAANAKKQRLGPDKAQETDLSGLDLAILSSVPASPNNSPANISSEITDLFKDVDMATETREAVQKAISIFEDRYAALQARVDNLENGKRRAKRGL
ncbi:hypothetical protein F4782DRAFT_507860 [Xylaria castorea]|nr:hypothetical protein F4782DRAFT_507860 [Xylaria castorea]